MTADTTPEPLDLAAIVSDHTGGHYCGGHGRWTSLGGEPCLPLRLAMLLTRERAARVSVQDRPGQEPLLTLMRTDEVSQATEAYLFLKSERGALTEPRRWRRMPEVGQ